jgi:hypothetical protein
MSKFVIAALTATLALAVAACGSGKSSSSGSGSTTTVQGGTDFTSLVEKSKTSAFKVTYKTSDGDTITIAQDGKGKESVVAGGKLFIDDGSTGITCDGTTSTATCRNGGTAGREAADAAKSVITNAATAIAGLASTSIFNGHTSSATIAGRDATCVTVDASDVTGVLGPIARRLVSGASGTVCADNETGVLLKLSGGKENDRTDVFVATDFAEPSESDFQPPSTPKSLPTIPQLTLPSG